MSLVLAVAWDGSGNLPPTLVRARQLAERGHGPRQAGKVRR